MITVPFSAASFVGTLLGNVGVDWVDGDARKDGWLKTFRNETIAAAESGIMGELFGHISNAFDDDLPEALQSVFSKKNPIAAMEAGGSEILTKMGVKKAGKELATQAERLAAAEAGEALEGVGLYGVFTLANQFITSVTDAFREEMS